MSQEARTRGERLQIMLTPEELVLIDDFRFKYRMPSRASAVRELLSRGLSAEGFQFPRRAPIPRSLVSRTINKRGISRAVKPATKSGLAMYAVDKDKGSPWVA